MTASAPSGQTGPTTFVVGHRNPDADAICSAIAYAAFKEARGEKGFVAARCGNSNVRIDTILARFKQPLPYYLTDVSPRVRDMMATEVISVTETATCAEALELIDHHHLRVLPVTSAKGVDVGVVSLSALGGVFIPRVSQPRAMRHVNTSLAHFGSVPVHAFLCAFCAFLRLMTWWLGFACCAAAQFLLVANASVALVAAELRPDTSGYPRSPSHRKMASSRCVSSSSLNCPTTEPIRSARKIVSLSTMACEARFSPLPAVGTKVTRNKGASASWLVIGQSVTLA